MSNSDERRILAKGISICLILGVLFTGVYFLVWKGPKEVAGATKDGAVEVVNEGYALFKRAGKDLIKALQFQPKVTIGSTTVLGPATELTEVVTASKTFEHGYTYEVSWAGSMKRLEIRGDFLAKAGYPLDDSFSLDLSEDGKTVTVHHGAPRLISCELTRLHVLRDQNGWWNKLKPQEREAAQNTLLQQARAVAADSDLMRTAAGNLMERLAPLGKRHDFVPLEELVP